jgi:hypothetical protein
VWGASDEKSPEVSREQRGAIQQSLVPQEIHASVVGDAKKTMATPGGYRRIGRSSDKPRITRLEQGPRRQKPNRSYAHGNGAASGECSPRFREKPGTVKMPFVHAILIFSTAPTRDEIRVPTEALRKD